MPYPLSLKSFNHKAWLLASVIVAGCHDAPTTKLSQRGDAPTRKPIAEMLAERAKNENQKVVKEGIEALLAGEFDAAGEHFNTALLDDPTNTWLHYLNGLRYHMVARQGDVTNYDLAKAGYEQSLKFDPTNTMASLQLGRVFSEQKDYLKAQNEFANVLLIQADNYDALYELACTSYYIGDIKTARMAIARAGKIHPNKPEVRKASAMILAAAGKPDMAQAELKQYHQLAQDTSRTKRLEGRVQDWRKLYNTGLVLAQADDSTAGGGVDADTAQDSAAPAATPDSTAAADKAGAEGAIAAATAAPSDGSAAPAVAPAPVPGLGEMVVFDAIAMRVSEVGTTSKGSNILDNFNLTLAPGTSLYARSFTEGGSGTAAVSGTTVLGAATSAAPGAGLSVTRIFASGISWGNVTYSMKIANARRQHIEVMGRPSLVASVGKAAKFFSGSELVAGLSGDNGGNLVKNPVGITLEVVPQSIKDGKIIFDVTIYGSLLNLADLERIKDISNITQKWSNIGMSKINTSVEIALGETIMLGGLTERIDTKDKSGFPVLQDIPLIQYFFSNETTSSERKSVMYLITPRTYDANKRGIQTADLNRRMTPNMSELELKNRDWYDPDYNMVVTMRHLAPLYREFRHGDIDSLQWDMPENFDENVEMATSFLYY